MPSQWGELEEDDVLRVLFSQAVIEEGLNVLESHDADMVELFSTTIKPIRIEPDGLTVGEALAVARRLGDAPSQERSDNGAQSANARKKSS